MTAYWIVRYQEIVDASKVAAYEKLAGPAIEAAGGTVLAHASPELTSATSEDQETVLVRFDSIEAARSAYEGPRYAAALAALDGGAVRDVRIVSGLA